MEAGTPQHDSGSYTGPEDTERPIEDVPTLPPLPAMVDESGKETSILDELRKRREQIGDPDATVILPVNGYGGRLLARYRKLPLRAVVDARKKISRRNPDETTATLTMAANVLIDACEAFMVVTNSGDTPVELQTTAEQLGDEPIRYEPRLALALAFEDKLAELPGAPRAVDIVRFTFSNTYALFAHFNAYDNWLKNTDSEDDESF